MKNLFPSKYRKIKKFFKHDISLNRLLTNCPIETEMIVSRNKRIFTKVAAKEKKTHLLIISYTQFFCLARIPKNVAKENNNLGIHSTLRMCLNIL